MVAASGRRGGHTSGGIQTGGDGCYGQTLLLEDVLLIQSEAGEVVLAEATPEEHRELARLPALQSKTWNNPVLAGDLLLVRNDLEAACYRLPLATGGSSTKPAANASR